MAEAKKKSGASAKSSTKATAAKSSTKAAAAKSSTKAAAAKTFTGLTLGGLKPAAGSWPKRQRIGRGHGSGMVKTGGEGGKGQTVRSGGGKGPAFEGGQTPWARRLPHNRGYSQKGRDTGHFGTKIVVLNLHQLASWDASVEISPETLKEKGFLKQTLDGVKILGGSRTGKTLPSGLRFRDILFSASALEALKAAGAQIEGA